MQVKYTNSGHFVLTAENEHDNNVLFVIVNSKTLEGVHFNHQESTGKLKAPEAVKEKRKYELHKKSYTVACAVEGCTARITSRGRAIHMRMAHGVDKQGKQYITFKHADGSNKPVSHPVVKLPNGWGVVKTPSLLD